MYNTGQRGGPGIVKTVDLETNSEVHQAFQKDMVWVLSRQINIEEQSVCGWTGFSTMVRKGIETTQDNLGYLPTIK